MSKLIFLNAIIVLSACTHATPPPPAEAKQVLKQNCAPGSTPVVDEKWNPLGCNQAIRNDVKENDPCEGFQAGARTIDVKGEIYECKD